MAAVSVESLLSDVSPQSPCGENLEFDPDYLELMRIAQGTPERQMGTTVIAAEEPNWRDVRDRCVAIFKRTKELTVTLKLCEALLRTGGLPGFRDGLAVLSGLLSQRWEQLYPRLDASDGNDPTMRLNIVASLTDPAQFLSPVRAVPLTNSVAGRFGLREIGWASGKGTPPGGAEPPKMEMIEAAFKGTPPEELRALALASNAAIELVKATDARITTLLGAGQGIDFEPLLKVLREVSMEIMRRLPGEPAVDLSAITPTGEATGGSMLPVRSAPGEIRSPEDVKAAIDRICQYYERVEPSSPIPLFLRRAQKLVGMNFLDIVQDMSPDAVKHVKLLGGIPE